MYTIQNESVPSFRVHVIIENKPGISDPEGETILRDLVLKKSHDSVSKIRSAKMLKFEIKASDKLTAEKKVLKLCNDLRIYNPLVSQVTLETFAL